MPDSHATVPTIGSSYWLLIIVESSTVPPTATLTPFAATGLPSAVISVSFVAADFALAVTVAVAGVNADPPVGVNVASTVISVAALIGAFATIVNLPVWSMLPILASRVVDPTFAVHTKLPFPSNGTSVSPSLPVAVNCISIAASPGSMFVVSSVVLISMLVAVATAGESVTTTLTGVTSVLSAMLATNVISVSAL